MRSTQTQQVTQVAPLLNTDGLLQRKCGCGQHTVAGGSCSDCEKKKGVAQRKAATGEAINEVPPIVHEVLRAPGRPLDDDTRAFMEPRFQHDFSRVRVHADSQSTESARSIGAMAYTVGQNVVFDSARYSPQTSAGRSLLAHELTHVIQQSEMPAATGDLRLGSHDSAEREADAVESSIASGVSTPATVETSPGTVSRRLQRRVDPANVSCRQTGLTNPNLTGDEAVAAIVQADAEAITLARRAELLLDVNLLFTRGGFPVDPAFDTILQEELGLTLTNPAHFRLIEQQRDRFQRVRETLESGFLRFICRGGTVNLVGCSAGTCGPNFALSCPGNRLIALCQAFWDTPAEQAATILHEPFHIWFDMARHAPNQPRRADASCFESFALRVAGQAATASCAGHTAG